MLPMDTIVSTVLISAPLAFIAGWVISKAVFKVNPNAMRGIRNAVIRSRQSTATIGADDRDAQIAELQQQLDVAEARILKSRRTFKTWRERIRPIARQFRQQRVIIAELRDELRRRDAAARQTEEAAEKIRQSKAEAPTEVPTESQAESQPIKAVEKPTSDMI